MTTTLTRDTANAERVTGVPIKSERYRMSTLSIMGILALVVGFGVGWLAFRDTGVKAPAEVQTLVDGYRDAWVARDGEAAVAMMDDGAHFYSWANPQGVTGEALADHIDTTFPGFVAQLEITAVEGDGPWLVVSTSDGTPGDFSVVHVADRGGELKILDHIWLDD